MFQDAFGGLRRSLVLSSLTKLPGTSSSVDKDSSSQAYGLRKVVPLSTPKHLNSHRMEHLHQKPHHHHKTAVVTKHA